MFALFEFDVHLSSASLGAVQVDLLDLLAQALLFFDFQQAIAGSFYVCAHSDGLSPPLPMVVLFIVVGSIVVGKIIADVERDPEGSIPGGGHF